MQKQGASRLDQVDTIIVGAGVIGLAIARAVANRGQTVLVVEAERHFGTQISSRNSEVVHAGLYYPPGSRKAVLCRNGRERLYSYCAQRGVGLRKCGKFIVAPEGDQQVALEALFANAQANDVDDLVLVDSATLARQLPAVRAAAAIWSPSSGIVDSHGFMLALLADAEAAGALVVFNTRATAFRRAAGNWTMSIAGEDEPVVAARTIINAAGLSATGVAQDIEGLAAAAIPATWLAKGSYFSYSGRHPFDHLVYPLPEPGGLGVHVTIDLAGAARFGPDVEWVDALDYDVDASRRPAFAAAIGRYWPDVDADRLQPAYSGIRPKIAPRDAPAADFRIDGEADHGLPGIINLFGIESPGLTASLAIADVVAAMIGVAP
jgi:L-2-hydroxyglutarate oxidase LhgO